MAIVPIGVVCVWLGVCGRCWFGVVDGLVEVPIGVVEVPIGVVDGLVVCVYVCVCVAVCVEQKERKKKMKVGKAQENVIQSQKNG